MSNPCVSLLFFWPELERQVRIEGLTKKITEKESDNYFSTRPLESRIGAWSSPQSEIIPSRKWLELEVKKTKTKFGNSPPRPKFWGGFIVTPSAFEFWQGRESRLHDRICYQSSASSKTDWTIVRLAP
ncbi:MAG: pyridoxamine 5'-phosphate oxidase [Candidatus Pelagibacter sp.]|nr:pyridoxamine 5'-phosphate oxidase [Candidatus Pelagibacter sp.]|tara:strand:- start:2253 stop:2636 length:384 start_codon:yes stop_codon:yes gene_type:complete